MPRKTIDIKNVIQSINGRIKTSASVEVRRELGLLATELLSAVNSYGGYNYNYWLKQGYQEWLVDGMPEFPEKEKYILGPTLDKTMVTYFVQEGKRKKSHEYTEKEVPYRASAIPKK